MQFILERKNAHGAQEHFCFMFMAADISKLHIKACSDILIQMESVWTSETFMQCTAVTGEMHHCMSQRTAGVQKTPKVCVILKMFFHLLASFDHTPHVWMLKETEKLVFLLKN